MLTKAASALTQHHEISCILKRDSYSAEFNEKWMGGNGLLYIYVPQKF